MIPDRRRALLRAALGFSTIRWHGDTPPAVRALAAWTDSWTGVGAVVGGMQRLGYEIELKQMADNWRVNLRPAGQPRANVAGTAWERTPWHATQRPAWEARKS